MSTSTLPPIHAGGLTQKVLKSLPREKVHDSWHKADRKLPRRPNSVTGGSLPTQSNELKDIAKYRNSYLHNLCVEMLKDGFHSAFRDLLNLIKFENEDLKSDNTEHADVPLEECADKLSYIKDKLIAVELAQRQGQSDKIYEAQYELSKFFEKNENFRLANQFYTASFNTSKQIRGDGRRKEAEANFNLGTAAEREKDYTLAREFYEKYYLLTANKEWKSSEGMLLHNHARDCLTRMLITLSEQLTPHDVSKVLEYLHKAYDLVQGCGDMNSVNGVNNVGYLLGSKYDYYDNHEKAVEYLTEYLELCKRYHDELGVGKAYQALAYRHQRQGNMDEATENLKMFLNAMENCGDVNTLREACTDLGALYNYMGKYEQSANYYKRAYEMAQSSNNYYDIESSRCEYGMALAHGLFNGMVDSITHCNKANIDMLLNWKSERYQSFTTDNQTYSMYPPFANLSEEPENIVVEVEETSEEINSDNILVSPENTESLEEQIRKCSLSDS